MKKQAHILLRGRRHPILKWVVERKGNLERKGNRERRKKHPGGVVRAGKGNKNLIIRYLINYLSDNE